MNSAAVFGSMVRSTYQGSVGDLVKKLEIFACRSDFVRDGPIVESRAAKQRRVLKFAPLVRQLAKLQSNLSFGRAKMEKAMIKVCEDAKWPDIVAKDHGKQMALSLRKILRFIQQARTKNPAAGWIKPLFETKGLAKWATDAFSSEEKPEVKQEKEEQTQLDVVIDSDGEASNSDVETIVTETQDVAFELNCPRLGEPSGNVEFLYGAQGGVAWRARVEDGVAQGKDFTTDLFEPKIFQPSTPAAMHARWPDGHTHEIAEITIANAETTTAKAEAEHIKKRPAAMDACSDSSTKTWTTKEGLIVRIKPKKDRHMLWQVCVGDKKRCQIRQDLLPDDGSYCLLEEVCQSLANGEVQDTELSQFRDKLLQAQGMATPSTKKQRSSKRSNTEKQQNDPSKQEDHEMQREPQASGSTGTSDRRDARPLSAELPPMMPDLF